MFYFFDVFIFIRRRNDENVNLTQQRTYRVERINAEIG
jgi:hypothetical protein